MIADEFYKNIVILGSGGTGITAALKLSRLFKNHYNVKINLIGNNFNIRNQLSLKLFSQNLKELNANRRLKKNLEYHIDNVKKIDLKNRRVYFGEKVIHFRFIVVDLTNRNYYELLKKSITEAGNAKQIIVDDYLREPDMPFVYLIGDNAIMKPDTGLLISAVNSVTLKQERFAAQNIYNEVYGYEMEMPA